MPRNLDIAALRSFLTVAETGGVTRGASQLNLTQSAVSLQIKRLEDTFRCTLFERNGRAVVVLRGELDLATAPDLHTALTELQEAGQDVAVDLRELAFMDSTGLRALVAAHARAQDGEQSFVIVRPLPGGPIERILAIAGVASVLEVVDDA